MLILVWWHAYLTCWRPFLLLWARKYVLYRKRPPREPHEISKVSPCFARATETLGSWIKKSSDLCECDMTVRSFMLSHCEWTIHLSISFHKIKDEKNLKKKKKDPREQQQQHKRLTGMNLGRIRTGKNGRSEEAREVCCGHLGMSGKGQNEGTLREGKREFRWKIAFKREVSRAWTH